MRLAWLAWYICGIFLLLALATRVTTYVPSIQYLGTVLPLGFGALAAAVAAMAIALGRTSPDSALQRSSLLRGGLIAVAIALTLFLVNGVLF